MKVVPIRGHFENAKAFLHDIAGDDNIESLVIVTFLKDGTAAFAHLKCRRRDMAFAGAVLQHQAAVSDDDDERRQ